MKPEDLRIGNYYNSVEFNTTVKCEMADISEIYQHAEGAEPDESDIAAIFEPITLIKDWLIKFKFIMSPYYEGGRKKLTKELDLEIRFYNDQILSMLRYGNYFHQKYELNNIKYVHSLQNFYYGFKLKELEIQTIEA